MKEFGPELMTPIRQTADKQAAVAPFGVAAA